MSESLVAGDDADNLGMLEIVVTDLAPATIPGPAPRDAVPHSALMLDMS